MLSASLFLSGGACKPGICLAIKGLAFRNLKQGPPQRAENKIEVPDGYISNSAFKHEIVGLQISEELQLLKGVGRKRKGGKEGLRFRRLSQLPSSRETSV